MELEGLAELDAVGDGDRAGLRVGPEQAPDQEVAPVEAGLVLVDDLADLEAAAPQQLVLAAVGVVDGALPAGVAPPGAGVPRAPTSSGVRRAI